MSTKDSSNTFSKTIGTVRNFAHNLAKEAEFQSHKLAPKLKEARASLSNTFDNLQHKGAEIAHTGLEKGSATWHLAKDNAAFISHKVNAGAQQKFEELKSKAPTLDEINEKVENLNSKFGNFSTEVKEKAKSSGIKAKASLNETIEKVKEKFNPKNEI